MPLVETDRLLNRFVELLDASTHVDIAVAWVGPGLAIEHVLELAENKEIRIVVGLSGNSTDPPTLRRLLEQVELRVAPAPLGGIFHAKFYRFGKLDGAVCWIGSANFTRRGFSSNVELVHEFADTDGDGGAWFETLWQGLDEDPLPAIVHYEEHYKPPGPGDTAAAGSTGRTSCLDCMISGRGTTLLPRCMCSTTIAIIANSVGTFWGTRTATCTL